MKFTSSLFVLLLVSGSAISADSSVTTTEPEARVLEPVLPPTSLERPENNPAKAAVAAREAQKKDERIELAKMEAAINGPPVSAETTRLIGTVREALTRDSRTAKLNVEVLPDGEGKLALRGTVPSIQSRADAETVATRAAAPQRVNNYLAVPAR